MNFVAFKEGLKSKHKEVPQNINSTRIPSVSPSLHVLPPSTQN